MIARLVAWCTRHSLLVIGVAVLVATAGEWARRSLSRDAVPDLSDPQIGMVVDWMGHPASEVATRVTQVLTESLRSIPGATAVRGASMSGMAYVDVVFASSRGLESARQAILDRVEGLRSRLPDHVRFQVSPPASSTGWIYQYALVDASRKVAAVPIGRNVQEELLRPALEAIPGVAEVASVGETAQELLVETDADQLRVRGVAFSDVVAAVRAEAHGVPDLQRIETLPLSDRAGGQRQKLRIGDVSHATLALDLPTGIADLNGTKAVVGGIVVARRDADPRAVIEEVRRTLERLRPRLPPQVEILSRAEAPPDS